VDWLWRKRTWENFHGLVRRHVQRALRIRQRIPFSEEAFHLILAGGVGVIGGLVNLLSHYSMETAKLLFLRRTGDLVEIAEILAPWERVIIPALGGLGAGMVLYWGLRLAGPQRSSNLLEVVVAGDGRLPFRSAIVKFMSSLVSIGTGASIGREGAITQLSATLASKWGQLAKWQPYRLRLLVGCGAAAGMSAAYNAPISGAVFAALIVVGNFSMNLFAPLVFSSVVATMVSRSFFGLRPWYSVPPFEFTSITQLPWFLFLGIAAGVVGALFLKLLNQAEEGFKKLAMPVYTRLAVGGLIVGLIALAVPGVWGNGYVITNRILQDHYPAGLEGLQILFFLFLAKFAATVITVGSGAVGGVFTPTLFLGAGLGATFGLLLQQFGAGQSLPLTTFSLVGMGAMLAATTRSPLLAMILILEISLDYSLMPPLMLASVVSILVAKKIHPTSIYTEPLRQKGVTVPQDVISSESATERTVGDVMSAPVEPIRETATLSEVAERFLTSSNNFLPVVDGKYQLLGFVALQDLKEYLDPNHELPGFIAYDVMRPPPTCVTPNQRLLDVLPVVLNSELRNIPVVNTLKENRLVGAISRSEVLAIFSEVIATRNSTESGST
jgi:CIC family chloride channel protein